MKKILTCLALALAGCSPKTVPVREHEPTLTATSGSGRGGFAKSTEVKTNSTQIDIKALLEKRESVVAALERGEYLELASDLEPVVLNGDFVAEPESLEEDRLRLLSLYQNALVQNLKRNGSEPRVQELANNFAQFALDGCDDRGDGCDNLGYFARSSLTSDIFVEIAKNLQAKLEQNAGSEQNKVVFETDLRRYYIVLRLGVLASRNRIANPEIPLLYVQFANEYGRLLEKLKLSDISASHWRTVVTVVQDISQHKKTAKFRLPYCDFVMGLKPLSANATQSRMGANPLPALISEFIDCASERNQLRQLVTEYVSAQRAKAQSIDHTSLTEGTWVTVQKRLRKSPQRLSAMMVEDQDLDPYLEFLLNGVYYDTLPLPLAEKYLRAANVQLKDDEVLRSARQYVHSQILFLMLKSQEILAKEMKKQMGGRDGLSPDFFSDTLNTVNDATRSPWQDLTRRVSLVKDFVKLIMEDKYGFRLNSQLSESEKVTADTYRRLDYQLNSIGTHLQYISSSPLMVPINFYMSKANGTIRFLLSWWKGRDGSNWISYDGQGALRRMIDDGGDLAQLFNYGESAYNTFDIVQSQYVLDVALRSGVFDTIPLNLIESENDKNKITDNEYLFFKRYLFETVEQSRTTLSNNYRNLMNLQRSEEYRTFLNSTCVNPLTAPAMLTLENLSFGTLLVDKVYSGIVGKLYSDNPLRNFNDQKDKAERLLRTFETYFMGEGAEKRVSPEKFARREIILAAMRDELDEHAKAARSLNKKWLELDREIVTEKRDCMERMYRADWYRRYKILDLNIEYYRNVHAAMAAMNVAESIQQSTTPEDFIRTVRQRSAALRNADVARRASLLINGIESSGLWAHHSAAVPLERLQNALNDYLGIHNEAREPFLRRDSVGRVAGEVGYFVNRIETAAEFGRRVKRNNLIEPHKFTQAVWDSLMRVRRQLQTAEVPIDEARQFFEFEDIVQSRPGMMLLAPRVDVQVNALSELENDTRYYANSNRVTVQYQESQEEFVRLAMTQFAGEQSLSSTSGTQHLSWFSSADIQGLRSRFQTLLDLHREPIEVSEKACPRNQWNEPVAHADCELVKVPPRDALNYFLKWSDLLTLTDLDRNYLRYLQHKSRFGSLAVEYFQFKAEPTTNKWTYFDKVYLLNYSSVRGTTQDGKISYRENIEGRDDFMVLNASVKNNFKPDNHLFPVNDSFFLTQRQRYRSRVMRHLYAVREFEKTVEALENESAVDKSKRLPDVVMVREDGPLRADENYVFDTYRAMLVKDRTSGPRAGTPIYLRDEGESSRVWFWNFLQSFTVKDTSCAFLPTQGESDFIETKDTTSTESKECLERFTNWKQKTFNVQ